MRLARMRRLPVSLMAAAAPSSCHDSHSVPNTMPSTRMSATTEVVTIRVESRFFQAGRLATGDSAPGP